MRGQSIQDGCCSTRKCIHIGEEDGDTGIRRVGAVKKDAPDKTQGYLQKEILKRRCKI